MSSLRSGCWIRIILELIALQIISESSCRTAIWIQGRWTRSNEKNNCSNEFWELSIKYTTKSRIVYLKTISYISWVNYKISKNYISWVTYKISKMIKCTNSNHLIMTNSDTFKAFAVNLQQQPPPFCICRISNQHQFINKIVEKLLSLVKIRVPDPNFDP